MSSRPALIRHDGTYDDSRENVCEKVVCRSGRRRVESRPVLAHEEPQIISDSVTQINLWIVNPARQTAYKALNYSERIHLNRTAIKEPEYCHIEMGRTTNRLAYEGEEQ